jgi:gas vesicle protein
MEESSMAEENDGMSVAWFFVGAAVGAAAALLLAPQTGEETRKALRRKAEEGRDVVSKSGKDVLERGRELFDKGKELADEAAEVFEKGKKALGA